MAFLDQLKEKASLASEKVVETTTNVIAEHQQNAEIKRKKNRIKELQGQIDDLFRIIGIKVFNAKEEATETELTVKEETEQIKKCYAEQVQLYQALNMESKDVWKCKDCSEITVLNNQFCPYCGSSRE